MSRASKITFGVTSAVTGLIILVVHNTQQAEQDVRMLKNKKRKKRKESVERKKTFDILNLHTSQLFRFLFLSPVVFMQNNSLNIWRNKCFF